MLQSYHGGLIGLHNNVFFDSIVMSIVLDWAVRMRQINSDCLM